MLAAADPGIEDARDEVEAVAAFYPGRSKTVIEYLQGIERQFGYFRNDVRNVALPGIEGRQTMARMLDLLRKEAARRR